MKAPAKKKTAAKAPTPRPAPVPDDSATRQDEDTGSADNANRESDGDNSNENPATGPGGPATTNEPVEGLVGGDQSGTGQRTAPGPGESDDENDGDDGREHSTEHSRAGLGEYVVNNGRMIEYRPDGDTSVPPKTGRAGETVTLTDVQARDFMAAGAVRPAE